MFKVENVTIPDGCCGQALPRQLGVSHEPRQHPGQVVFNDVFKNSIHTLVLIELQSMWRPYMLYVLFNFVFFQV